MTLMLPALSVRQPWADAIRWWGKDIENRSWSTDYRGWFLLHAAGQPDPELDRACGAIANAAGMFSTNSLPVSTDYGGIVGCVRLVDVVRTHPSRWYRGPFGWVLQSPIPLPFRPLRGRLGLFPVQLTNDEVELLSARGVLGV